MWAAGSASDRLLHTITFSSLFSDSHICHRYLVVFLVFVAGATLHLRRLYLHLRSITIKQANPQRTTGYGQELRTQGKHGAESLAVSGIQQYHDNEEIERDP